MQAQPLKCAAALAAALAVCAPATDAWARDWRPVWVTVTNNTTTPATTVSETSVPEGLLPVSCDGTRFSPMQKDQTQVVRCTVRVGESLTLTYAVHPGEDQTEYVTVDFDCRRSAAATFTGSGQSIVYTKACTDPDDSASGGDDTGDDGGDSGTGGDG